MLLNLKKSSNQKFDICPVRCTLLKGCSFEQPFFIGQACQITQNLKKRYLTIGRSYTDPIYHNILYNSVVN
jgi:hypothetical protein